MMPQFDMCNLSIPRQTCKADIDLALIGDAASGSSELATSQSESQLARQQPANKPAASQPTNQLASQPASLPANS